MELIKFLISYRIGNGIKRLKIIDKKKLENYMCFLFESSLKKVTLCQKSSSCFKCVGEEKNCALISSFLEPSINIYFSYSERLNVLNFLWVLYDKSIELVPKVMLIHELLHTAEKSTIFKLKRINASYQNTYNNSQKSVFRNKHFDWDNYLHSITNIDEIQVINLLKEREFQYTLFFYRLVIINKGHNINATNFKNDMNTNNFLDLFSFNGFEYSMNKENLHKFISYYLNNYNNKNEYIIDKLFNSSVLNFNFRLNKVEFNYILHDRSEINLFTMLIKKGLMNINLKDVV